MIDGGTTQADDPGGVREQPEQTMNSKPVGSSPLWLLFQFCLQVPFLTSSAMESDLRVVRRNKAFPPHRAFGHGVCHSSQTVTRTCNTKGRHQRLRIR